MNIFTIYRLGLTLIAMSLAVLIGACGDTVGPKLHDTVAPAAITDLTVDSVVNCTAFLSWSAPGDDSLTGTAAEYDLRYTTNSASLVNNWSSTTVATGLPTPLVAGSTQTYHLAGLIADSVYYVGIKAIDDSDNVSGISNIITAGCTSALELIFPDVRTSECTSVAVPLTVKNFSAVSGLQLYVAYEPTQVTFDSMASAFLSDALLHDSAGVVRVVWADMTLTSPINLDDDLALATFHFSSLADSCALSLTSETKVVDTAGAYFTVDLTNGSLTCTAR